jgi:hypothetical protein
MFAPKKSNIIRNAGVTPFSNENNILRMNLIRDKIAENEAKSWLGKMRGIPKVLESIQSLTSESSSNLNQALDYWQKGEKDVALGFMAQEYGQSRFPELSQFIANHELNQTSFGLAQNLVSMMLQKELQTELEKMWGDKAKDPNLFSLEELNGGIEAIVNASNEKILEQEAQDKANFEELNKIINEYGDEELDEYLKDENSNFKQEAFDIKQQRDRRRKGYLLDQKEQFRVGEIVVTPENTVARVVRTGHGGKQVKLSNGKSYNTKLYFKEASTQEAKRFEEFERQEKENEAKEAQELKKSRQEEQKSREDWKKRGKKRKWKSKKDRWWNVEGGVGLWEKSWKGVEDEVEVQPKGEIKSNRGRTGPREQIVGWLPSGTGLTQETLAEHISGKLQLLKEEIELGNIPEEEIEDYVEDIRALYFLGQGTLSNPINTLKEERMKKRRENLEKHVMEASQKLEEEADRQKAVAEQAAKPEEEKPKIIIPKDDEEPPLPDNSIFNDSTKEEDKTDDNVDTSSKEETEETKEEKKEEVKEEKKVEEKKVETKEEKTESYTDGEMEAKLFGYVLRYIKNLNYSSYIEKGRYEMAMQFFIEYGMTVAELEQLLKNGVLLQILNISQRLLHVDKLLTQAELEAGFKEFYGYFKYVEAHSRENVQPVVVPQENLNPQSGQMLPQQMEVPKQEAPKQTTNTTSSERETGNIPANENLGTQVHENVSGRTGQESFIPENGLEFGQTAQKLATSGDLSTVTLAETNGLAPVREIENEEGIVSYTNIPEKAESNQICLLFSDGKGTVRDAYNKAKVFPYPTLTKVDNKPRYLIAYHIGNGVWEFATIVNNSRPIQNNEGTVERKEDHDKRAKAYRESYIRGQIVHAVLNDQDTYTFEGNKYKISKADAKEIRGATNYYKEATKKAIKFAYAVENPQSERGGYLYFINGNYEAIGPSLFVPYFEVSFNEKNKAIGIGKISMRPMQKEMMELVGTRKTALRKDAYDALFAPRVSSTGATLQAKINVYDFKITLQKALSANTQSNAPHKYTEEQIRYFIEHGIGGETLRKVLGSHNAKKWNELTDRFKEASSENKKETSSEEKKETFPEEKKEEQGAEKKAEEKKSEVTVLSPLQKAIQKNKVEGTAETLADLRTAPITMVSPITGKTVTYPGYFAAYVATKVSMTAIPGVIKIRIDESLIGGTVGTAEAHWDKMLKDKRSAGTWLKDKAEIMKSILSQMIVENPKARQELLGMFPQELVTLAETADANKTYWGALREIYDELTGKAVEKNPELKKVVTTIPPTNTTPVTPPAVLGGDEYSDPDDGFLDDRITNEAQEENQAAAENYFEEDSIDDRAENTGEVFINGELVSPAGTASTNTQGATNAQVTTDTVTALVQEQDRDVITEAKHKLAAIIKDRVDFKSNAKVSESGLKSAIAQEKDHDIRLAMEAIIDAVFSRKLKTRRDASRKLTLLALTLPDISHAMFFSVIYSTFAELPTNNFEDLVNVIAIGKDTKPIAAALRNCEDTAVRKLITSTMYRAKRATLYFQDNGKLIDVSERKVYEMMTMSKANAYREIEEMTDPQKKQWLKEQGFDIPSMTDEEAGKLFEVVNKLLLAGHNLWDSAKLWEMLTNLVKDYGGISLGKKLRNPKATNISETILEVQGSIEQPLSRASKFFKDRWEKVVYTLSFGQMSSTVFAAWKELKEEGRHVPENIRHMTLADYLYTGYQLFKNRKEEGKIDHVTLIKDVESYTFWGIFPSLSDSNDTAVMKTIGIPYTKESHWDFVMALVENIIFPQLQFIKDGKQDKFLGYRHFEELQDIVKKLQEKDSNIEEIMKQYRNTFLEVMSKALTADIRRVLASIDEFAEPFEDPKKIEQERLERIDFAANMTLFYSNMIPLFFGHLYNYQKGVTFEDFMINFGKRAKGQITPYDKMDNSAETSQILITVKDVKRDVKGFEGIARAYDVPEDIIAKGRDAIVAAYPELEKYLNLDITDGQEYCTWRNYLDILNRSGEISDTEKLEAISNIENGRPPKVSFQPLKGVTSRIQENGDFIFIKSAIFPLLPSITAGSEMDKIRTTMEAVEKREGKFVRVTTASSVKVGPFEFNTWEDVRNGTVKHYTVSDTNFGLKSLIPQTVEEHLDVASIQMLEAVLGLADTEAELALAEEFRSGVYEKMRDKTRKKFSEIVKKHGGRKKLKAAYLAGDLQAMSEVLSEIGTLMSELNFKGSNRIVVSDFNFDWKNNKDIIFTDKWDPEKGLQNYGVETIEKEVEVKEKGKKKVKKKITTKKLRYVQVAMALDITVRDKKTGEDKHIDLTKYAKEIDGRLVINTSLLPEEVFKTYSYRTPFSSAASGQLIEVVAILPSYMGNTIIVPDSNLAQIGEDFDIDEGHIINYEFTMNEKSEELKVKPNSFNNAFIDLAKILYDSRRSLALLPAAFPLLEKEAQYDPPADDSNFSPFSMLSHHAGQSAGLIAKDGIALAASYSNFLRILIQSKVSEIVIPDGINFGSMKVNPLDFDGKTGLFGDVLMDIVGNVTTGLVDNQKSGVMQKNGVTPLNYHDYIIAVFMLRLGSYKGRFIPSMLFRHPIIKEYNAFLEQKYTASNKDVMSNAEVFIKKLLVDNEISANALDTNPYDMPSINFEEMVKNKDYQPATLDMIKFLNLLLAVRENASAPNNALRFLSARVPADVDKIMRMFSSLAKSVDSKFYGERTDGKFEDDMEFWKNFDKVEGRNANAEHILFVAQTVQALIGDMLQVKVHWYTGKPIPYGVETFKDKDYWDIYMEKRYGDEKNFFEIFKAMMNYLPENISQYFMINHRLKEVKMPFLSQNDVSTQLLISQVKRLPQEFQDIIYDAVKVYNGSKFLFGDVSQSFMDFLSEADEMKLEGELKKKTH